MDDELFVELFDEVLDKELCEEILIDELLDDEFLEDEILEDEILEDETFETELMDEKMLKEELELVETCELEDIIELDEPGVIDSDDVELEELSREEILATEFDKLDVLNELFEAVELELFFSPLPAPQADKNPANII